MVAVTTKPAAVDNPLREGLRMHRTADPCAVVMFGATGDLAHRKLYEAFYNLSVERRLPQGFAIVGFARRPLTDDEFRESVKESVEKYARNKPSQRPSAWNAFAQGLFYVSSDFDDAEGYTKLASKLEEVDKQRGTMGNRIFYLSTPPDFYSHIIGHLGESGLASGKSQGVSKATSVLNTGTLNPNTFFAHDGTGAAWRRIVVEKPFGHDLASAQELNRQISEVFPEDHIFRIDHYLGKETVQNILVFRFANGIFEPLWSRRYVDHVQITVAESLGVEDRASYYETAGALRDMLQNHMMELLTLVAMEPPTAFDAQSVRDEKAKVLRAVKPFATPGEVAQNTIRGQYGPGAIYGKAVPGYRQEKDIPHNSNIETYVAARFFVDNWRWAGVPFYLRHGKRLPKRDTEISIHFKAAPHALFQHTAADELEPNVLVLHIQPDEGISLNFESKLPGPSIKLRSVEMNFNYGASFGIEFADAYERLLMDAMLGDTTLFTRRDEVELMWLIATSILEGWEHIPPPTFPNYRAGSWGPAVADELIARDGRSWRRL
ncbi:MAG TPA: glucose-6-phosphate dehydrogenase [Chloroflexia bacterium]|nr:glucose-6-phosphate dehydrogenase [Chloroflexia bacterium]